MLLPYCSLVFQSCHFRMIFTGLLHGRFIDVIDDVVDDSRTNLTRHATTHIEIIEIVELQDFKTGAPMTQSLWFFVVQFVVFFDSKQATTSIKLAARGPLGRSAVINKIARQ